MKCVYPDCRCVGPCNDQGPRDEREGGPTNRELARREPDTDFPATLEHDIQESLERTA